MVVKPILAIALAQPAPQEADNQREADHDHGFNVE